MAQAVQFTPHPQGTIYSQSQPVEQPLAVRIPGQSMNMAERSLLKFSQLIMMLIALASIWGGLVYLAFDDTATNTDFFIIFLGGIISATLVIGWIELQSKKNDHVLYEVQDYMLGIAFFFATVGAIWGTRWLMGVASGYVDFFGPASGGNDWQPNANGIYVQTAALVLVAVGQIQLLKRYKGSTGFGRAVAAYAPIITLIGAGIGPWMDWTNNEISYEFGISLIVLCFLSMELALRSNKAFNFVVVAVASGLTPILFEMYNTNVVYGGEGGALSLLVFIIAIQGYYASREELRSELIQKASIVLVGEVLFAMMFARAENLNLHLGPFKPHVLEIEAFINLPVALWIAVLVFYFPAVLNRRVPWMPVGLAVALAIMPNDGSILPWVITLAMIPYMLFISKATRLWVANFTVTALAAAYFVTDFYAGYIREPFLAQNETFGLAGMEIVLPIALFVIAEVARRTDKISMWAHLVMLAVVVLSRAVLDAEWWFMPWLLIGYMLFITRDSFLSLTTESPYKEREKATLLSFITFSAMIILVFLDQFQLPEALQETPLPEFFNYQVFILGTLSYIALYSARNIELDLGLLLSSTNRIIKDAPTYDPETNTWKESTGIQVPDSEWEKKNSWGQLMRVSLIIPFLMMSLSVVSISGIFDSGFNFDDSQYMGAIEQMIEQFWFCLILIPVIGLVLEIRSMDVISSTTRSAGIWALFTVVLPLSFLFASIRADGGLTDEQTMGIFIASIILDIIILSAPLYVNQLISKRGVDKDYISKRADAAAMFGLIALACLDNSGGLLILSMMTLVTVRSLEFNHVLPLILSPFVYLWHNDSWLTHPGISQKLIEFLDSSFADSLVDMELPGFTRLAGFLILIQMITVWIVDAKLYNDSKGKRLIVPWPAICAWLFVGIVSMFSSLGWVPAMLMFALVVHAWITGRLESLLLMILGFWFALMFGFAYENSEFVLTHAFSWSSLYTGLLAGALLLLNERELLTRYVPLSMEEGSTELRISPEKVSEIIVGLYATCYIFLTLSFEALLGVGTVIGAVLLTRDIVLKGQLTGLLFAPAIHGLAFYNLLFQIDIEILPISALTGLFLLGEGAVISWFSLKNDEIYDFKYFDWSSDNEFLDFVDRVGMAGILTVLTGLFLLLGEWSQWQLAWLLTTIILIVNGVQGYSPEHDARWRRIAGGYGSIVSFIAFITFVDAKIWVALSWISLGLIALGWGFLSMQRLEDDEGTFEMVDEQGQSLPVAMLSTAQVAQPVTEISIPEPVASPSDVEDEPSSGDSESESATEEVESKPEFVELPSLPMPETIKTDFEFDIRLPPGKLDSIMQSIDTTEHDGYKPVVGFSQNGQIVIDWVAL
jgi:hypothetical protein